jgi:hypothetical protein
MSRVGPMWAKKGFHPRQKFWRVTEVITVERNDQYRLEFNL